MTPRDRQAVRTRSFPPNVCEPLPPRNFLTNCHVYFVLSQRAGGLSIGINMNPDKRCNFDCVYCEVDRRKPGGSARVPVREMISELEGALAMAAADGLRVLTRGPVEPGLLELKEVALSGDGEPTLCPNFRQVVDAVVQLRARGRGPSFRLVLITNASGLHLPGIRAGIALLAGSDEIWVKLDVGTQDAMNRINRSEVPLEIILANILELARARPVVIQSLFPVIDGREPGASEIDAYVERLRALKDEGAAISLVQVYSAHRPAMNTACAHLPLRSLSQIAQTIRRRTGLAAEVF